jgi:tetratricopeptide (TPR) repeat protein
MSYVFLATDLKHGRQVALKVLRPELAASVGVERFLREIQIEASLQHPNILPLYDSGEADRMLYYSMPYLDGETLREKLRRETQLDVDEALRIAREVVDAVAYAHGHDVVHRDIKPENILLSEGHAHVADFGVARAVSEAGGEQLTDSGIAVGTPAYMSPEQALASSNIDFRSDVYSLGLVVYEMFAGEPPFTGPTPLAVLARHAKERVPSLEVVRPTVPSGIITVIEKALQKVPADRYQTAAAFGEALAEGATTEIALDRPRIRSSRRRWPLPAGAATVLVLLLALWWFVFALPVPNPDWVLVYPLEVSGDVGPAEADLGDDNAYLIWNALDGRTSLRWINALDRVDDPSVLSGFSARRRRSFARSQRAGYYLFGRTMSEGDGWRTYLWLQDVETDSVVARANTVGQRSEARLLGVRATAPLLLEFLPEETVDVSAIAGREAEAVQTFVQAERHFHAGRFVQAFEHYSEAVSQDSMFALAAVKGAQAASWLHEVEIATGLIDAALSHAETLTPKHMSFARGLEAFFAASADTAVFHFERALAIDSAWSEAWTGLGEVYTHLVPRKAPQDSLAQDAFLRVYGSTDGSAPALYHLVEYAIRDGDLASASEFLRQYRAASPDTLGYAVPKLELMLRCVREGPGVIDWRDLVLRDVRPVSQAARSLGVGAAYPDCAMAAWMAIIDFHASEADGYMYKALVGLQSLLAATGRDDELIALMDSALASGSQNAVSAKRNYVAYYLAGARVDLEAKALVDSFKTNLWNISDARLWSVGVWDVDRNNLESARTIRDTLNSRTATDDRPVLSQWAMSLSAHVAAAEGDTTRAIALLQSITPAAHRGNVYYFWNSMGLERLLHARLLMARREYKAAYDVAAGLDSPGAVNIIYPLFVPLSLEIRLQSARALNDQAAVQAIEARLSALGR